MKNLPPLDRCYRDYSRPLCMPFFRFQLWSWYTFKGFYLNIRTALVLLLAIILFGVIGFVVLEDYTLVEAFYMTVITISTVGFSEVKPLGANGQLFASILIILNVGTFAYILAAFSYYVIQGELFKRIHLRFMENMIDELENHVILCGYGRYGKEVATHFHNHNVPFVIIDRAPDIIEQIQRSAEKLIYVEGDATDEDVLIKAGIHRAIALISALPEDTGNVFTVLTARQLNKTINIISRAQQKKSVSKISLAGANHVVMPEQIGSFYMATLVDKPESIEFFIQLSRDSGDIGFEELTYETMPLECRDKSIQDLSIRQETGANIIGFRQPNGQFMVNPPPHTILVRNSSFIVLGSQDQIDKLKNYLENYSESSKGSSA